MVVRGGGSDRAWYRASPLFCHGWIFQGLVLMSFLLAFSAKWGSLTASLSYYSTDIGSDNSGSKEHYSFLWIVLGRKSSLETLLPMLDNLPFHLRDGALCSRALESHPLCLGISVTLVCFHCVFIWESLPCIQINDCSLLLKM